MRREQTGHPLNDAFDLRGARAVNFLAVPVLPLAIDYNGRSRAIAPVQVKYKFPVQYDGPTSRKMDDSTFRIFPDNGHG